VTYSVQSLNGNIVLRYCITVERRILVKWIKRETCRGRQLRSRQQPGKLRDQRMRCRRSQQLKWNKPLIGGV